MSTNEIILRWCVMVDECIWDVKAEPGADLYPSEIVTVGLLFALSMGSEETVVRKVEALYVVRQLLSQRSVDRE